MNERTTRQNKFYPIFQTNFLPILNFFLLLFYFFGIIYFQFDADESKMANFDCNLIVIWL